MNNNREWFQENKELYISDVRDPMLTFISDFGGSLYKISPNFLADPRPTGGSLFRVYRDIRFSKDKSPYKTHVAAQFRHVRGKDVHAPGFYLHLEPGMVFAGSGIWHPDSKTATAVREAISENPSQWKSAVSGKEFKRICTLEGESLKRPPRGFDFKHPFLEDLMRKDFVAIVGITEKQACASDFLARFTKLCRVMAPFMKFLTKAVRLEW